jgi:hypothetical protein
MKNLYIKIKKYLDRNKGEKLSDDKKTPKFLISIRDRVRYLYGRNSYHLSQADMTIKWFIVDESKKADWEEVELFLNRYVEQLIYIDGRRLTNNRLKGPRLEEIVVIYKPLTYDTTKRNNQIYNSVTGDTISEIDTKTRSSKKGKSYSILSNRIAKYRRVSPTRNKASKSGKSTSQDTGAVGGVRTNFQGV